MTLRPPPPPRAGRSAPPAAATTEPAAPQPGGFIVSRGRANGGKRIVLYGPGGVGKTTLASLIGGRTAFLDVESGSGHLDIERIGVERGGKPTIDTFAELRKLLQSQALDIYANVVVDTATKVEELAIAYTLATVPHEKGGLVGSIEGYGFGKGYQHVYETFLLFLADLDRLVQKGKNVVLVCHECVADVPNPSGDDFIRYEPHLQAPKSGKSSIRNRVIQWADAVLFVGYDVLTKDGKGKGGGTRTIWLNERPDHIAKARREDGLPPEQLVDSRPYERGDGSVWGLLIGGTP